MQINIPQHGYYNQVVRIVHFHEASRGIRRLKRKKELSIQTLNHGRHKGTEGIQAQEKMQVLE